MLFDNDTYIHTDFILSLILSTVAYSISIFLGRLLF